MNYYQFHIGDFRSGTVNLTRQARWIYRDMLDVYYDSESPFPCDLEMICDMIGVESEDDRKIVEKILRLKFVQSDDGYRQMTCDSVIAEYHAKAEIAKVNGKLGGRPRKANDNLNKPSRFQSGSDQVPLANLELTGSEANQEPITKNQSKKLLSGKPDEQAVLSHLNNRTGKDFRPVDSNIRLISARLAEGATVDECKAVIDAKVTEWLGDKSMEQYLRPATLFSATNFAQYIGGIGSNVKPIKRDPEAWRNDLIWRGVK